MLYCPARLPACARVRLVRSRRMRNFNFLTGPARLRSHPLSPSYYWTTNFPQSNIIALNNRLFHISRVMNFYPLEIRCMRPIFSNHDIYCFISCWTRSSVLHSNCFTLVFFASDFFERASTINFPTQLSGEWLNLSITCS